MTFISVLFFWMDSYYFCSRLFMRSAIRWIYQFFIQYHAALEARQSYWIGEDQIGDSGCQRLMKMWALIFSGVASVLNGVFLLKDYQGRSWILNFILCFILSILFQAVTVLVFIWSIGKVIIISNLPMNAANPMVSEQSGEGYYVAQFKTTELAIFSYYIQSNKECLLIDPIFNVQQYLDFINKRHATLRYVLLSHYHADYISGHNEFKVPVVMGPMASRTANKFKVKEAKDEERLKLGEVSVTVIHTPGHTLESSCFLLRDRSEASAALFTGDTVFLGDVGRPDLAVSSNISKEDLAGMLFDSVQKLRVLGNDLRLYPGHGSGSSCGKAIGAGNFCTLGAQQQKNYGFKLTDRKEFIRQLTANMPNPPQYFFFDAHTNQVGPSHYPSAFKKAHIGLSIEEFQKSRAKVKLVDTRREVGAGIVRGSYWLPQSGPMASLISNFVAPTEEFLLLTEEGRSEEVMERLFRIGYCNMRGYNGFEASELKAELVQPVILKFITLKHLDNGEHLDVRNPGEWRSTGVIKNATLIPLPELEARIGELKGKKDILINCLSGMRSKVAFSVLAKHGITSKVIAQDFKEFKNHGLPVVDYQP